MATSNYIDIHSHNKEEEKDIIRYINLFPEQVNKFLSTGNHYFTIGIHPWYIREYALSEDYDLIRKYCEQKNFKAVGEIGLDRITDFPMDKQIEIFEQQLEIAELAKKPVIIHCVKAFSELIGIKKKRGSKIPWLIHGYNNNAKIAQELLLNNCYLSFGYHLLVDNTNAQKVLKQVPINTFLLETDDKEVEIEDIYKKAAEIKKITIEKLKGIINYNYCNIFGE